MFYRTMWGGFGGRPLGHDLMWSAYFNGLLSVDLENMPEDAEPDAHVGMRPSLSPALSPAKGPLSSSEGPMANGAPDDRPPRMNGAPEEDKIQEYLQRSDTAVIFPEPVGGKSPKKNEKGPPTPEPNPVIEEPKVPNEYLLKCPHCEQVFSGQQAIGNLKEHLAATHKEAGPPEANFVCQKCNASFTCKENLTKHKLFHATNGQTRKSALLQKVINIGKGKNNRTNFEHPCTPSCVSKVSTVSTDENAVLRKFKCTECGKAFKFKHHLKEHIRIHSGEKPFGCLNCGKRFSHSGSFSSHNTSKKCLVVNLKVRKVNSRSPRGRGTQNNSFRPIIPKYASPGNNGPTPRTPEMPLIPAGYMPSSERFSSFSGRPQQPYLPLAFHPLISQPHYHLPMGGFPEVSHLLQQRRFENDCPPSSEHHSTPQLPHHMLSPTVLDKVEDLDNSSPKPQGELNAVKKILEIVDATVSKQQQSPTRPRNGLLSELLSSGPHPMIKTPPPSFGTSSDSDARCRFCSRLFESKVDQYQHERYLCPHNSDNRTKSESSEIIQENGSDGESVETDRNRSSPSSLSVECVLMLKAHYQVNPHPKKSELIRLSRDLKCSTKTVQDWFHNQQMRSKGYPMNGEISHSSSPVHQSSVFSFHSPIPRNGHSFQQTVIPSYNGAISSSSHLVPYRPIPNRSPLLDATHPEDDQPLDLSIKIKSEEMSLQHEMSSNNPPSAQFESEVLNLSQRSTRTPSKESRPFSVQSNYSNHVQHPEESDLSQNHIQSSLLYKYMQMGSSKRKLSPQREKSPTAMPSSPERSPCRAEQQPQSMPSPDHASYADHSSIPNGTTESYGHTEEQTEPHFKKMRLWNQTRKATLLQKVINIGKGENNRTNFRHPCTPSCVSKGEGDESTLEGSLGAEEDSLGRSGKMRKSWKRHKMESEEGMYACDQCDKMFNKQSSLARHKYEHSGLRPHKCDVCSKAFKHKHHLTEHKRLHSGEKPFQCRKCRKRFSHSGSYSQHMNHRYSYCKPFHE